MKIKNTFIILTTITFCLISVFSVSNVYAQTPEKVISAGLKPGDTFYFLDNFMESMSLLITRNPKKRLEKLIEYADEKADEVNKLGNEKAVSAVERYNKYVSEFPQALEKAEEKGINTDDLTEKFSENSLKHLEVLSRVYEQVPSQAQSAIRQAIQNSEKSHEASVQRIRERMEIREQNEAGEQQGVTEQERIREENQISTPSGNMQNQSATPSSNKSMPGNNPREMEATPSSVMQNMQTPQSQGKQINNSQVNPVPNNLQQDR